MLCAVNSQVVKGKERSKKKSANQRKSREEGKTKGEISGQIDQPAIPNTTKHGDEFTRVSKRFFLSTVKPLSTKYTYHCNWSPFDKLCREKAEE